MTHLPTTNTARLVSAPRPDQPIRPGEPCPICGDPASSSAYRDAVEELTVWHTGDVRCSQAPVAREDLAGDTARPPQRARVPRVVTLCGSMRFFAQMLTVAAELTSSGDIVLAPFQVLTPAAQRDRAEEKARLDELHRHKIDRSDVVVVVSDPTGYYGASTRSEIAYATARGLPVTYRQIPAARSAAGPRR